IYDISWDSTQATYDLAGNLTSLTYPSGRKVTQGFNSAAQLNRVTFDSFSGTAVNYNYLSSASYSPAGAPTGLTLGNGITELTSYNSRLQPVQFVVPDPVLANTSLINKLYSFNAGSANNGNVASITDQLNSGRTQSFTYDHLNRLSTAQSSATSGTDCWGLSFGYDVWANLLSSSTTKCSPPNLNYSIDPSTNRISSPGFTYDTAGNMTYDPGTQKSYQWDAESRMKTLNTTGATYTYDANGSRVRKQSGTDFTEYIYFGSQPIAERNADGSWSDYIFAGGKRVARADSYEDRIRIYGTNCSNCGWQWAHFSFPSAGGLSGYTIRAGDRIYWRQYQGGGARGGIYLQFSDGSNSAWGVTDQDGQTMNADSWGGWHSRRVDLGSNFLNKVVTDLVLSDEGYNSGGWDIYFQDIAVVSTDGTVRPIWSRQKSVSLNVSATSGMTGVGYELNHDAGGYGMDLAHNGTTYYHGDHLGSSRQMSSAQGYPVWEATYLPFGQEWNAQSTVNHYKFTGKERDTESNLDYFGARYYSSTQGRFLSPDEFTGGPIDVFGPADPSPPGPLPYAEIANPQSLNKYAYTFNNPTRFIDPNGHGVMDFILGVGNAVTSNFANGIGRDNPSNSSQAAGQKVGDAISAVGGFIEMAAGSLAVVGGASEALITLPAAGTGAGAAIPAAGIATAAGGLVVATHGAVVLGKSISMMRAHGNTAGNQPAELYEKTDKDGNLEKHGVSQDASKRYSKTEVGEGKVTVTDRGPRKKMLAKERQKVEKNPGPENHEPWAGKKKKGQ
ncbi:MAG: hypothetical protein HY046_02575, partial [Acidobacteria bacterium]|nr:hypothetical protein [Acidobacteriota bacterium]